MVNEQQSLVTASDDLRECEIETWDRAPSSRAVWQWDCVTHNRGAAGFTSEQDARDHSRDCPDSGDRLADDDS